MDATAPPPPPPSAEVLCGCYIPTHKYTHHTTWSGYTLYRYQQHMYVAPPPTPTPPTKFSRLTWLRVLKGVGGGGWREKTTEYIHIFPRDETGLVCLATQLERTLQLYW